MNEHLAFLRKRLHYAENDLKSVIASFDVGLRTATDVTNAQKMTDDARTELEPYQKGQFLLIMPRAKQTWKAAINWSDKELKNLAIAFQKYGTGDIENIAKEIGTRSEADVKKLIKCEVDEIRKKRKIEMKMKGMKPPSQSLNRASEEEIKSWTCGRKWMKIIENQMPFRAQKQDYSRGVIKNLCQKFYEEAEETTNPQVLNVKAIYKFMLDCISGQNPGTLSPLDSAFVLLMFNHMREMLRLGDFQEEIDFIHNFRKATSFILPQPKKEYDSYRRSGSDPDPSCVPIPHHLYENFMRHHQVFYSFNPLVVPLWLLEKEQKYVKELLERASSGCSKRQK
ncbi:hypothetical protein CDAR_203481 [Caerostris darwini]|uniref:Uncharacterized protein n=1 Tax=Caerostris darwini TaxID=1538125 RepID=A0AAV4QB61_9ARAC|nr:hypothetical protein CDAR_203211 [Caerostris darwini]GIY05336.1 hypothetical protein CDAR_203481 [Caerostris darwini]